MFTKSPKSTYISIIKSFSYILSYIDQFFFVVSAIDANKSLKVLVVSYGLVIISPLSRKSTVGTLEATVFREIRDFIPFHVFLVLF